MSFTLMTLSLAICLFLGMLLLFEVGRRVGIARLVHDPAGVEKGSGPVEAAVFGLLGLLLAFTFSGAASRFEERRYLIGSEANAIGTAYLRIDLLPVDAQPEIRRLFSGYVDARLAAYRDVNDEMATQAGNIATATLQREIWSKAVAASHRADASTDAAMLLVPALNEMIDITTKRSVAMHDHPPIIIFILLAGLSLISAMVAGYVMCGTRKRSWFYILIVSITMSLTLYVILDLEYPRQGLIRINTADQTLADLQKMMKAQ